MESLLNRYRNVTILLLVIFAQLVVLAYQVKNDQDVRIIRLWAVTAVTPLARALEGVRTGTVNFVRNYFMLRGVGEENRRLKAEMGRLKMENQFLKSELSTADRARALSVFQARTQSKTIAARVIATGTGTTAKIVFVDRGSTAGVQKGMGVVTPDGIVGKVLASFPTASEVMLITDNDFAAGVISQKNQVKGTLKGTGYDTCRVEYVQVEERVEVGEWFYTSGDDRVFPKGFPVGKVKALRSGSPFKEILLDPVGMEHGLEEVLILLEGVHQALPEVQAASAPIYLAPPPPGGVTAGISPVPGKPAGVMTDADRLRERYKEIGEVQGHKFGEGLPGSKPPDFNLNVKPQTVPAVPKPATPEGRPPPVRPQNGQAAPAIRPL